MNSIRLCNNDIDTEIVTFHVTLSMKQLNFLQESVEFARIQTKESGAFSDEDNELLSKFDDFLENLIK